MFSFKNDFLNFIHALQIEICQAIETIDAGAVFQEDTWERAEGGGGNTRVLANGKVFEKAGVNTSAVFGQLPLSLKNQFTTQHDSFFACGISLVIHPENPNIPTVHANFRYFELYNSFGHLVDQWFGGGTDLTPYYFEMEDAQHFHAVLKKCCDAFDEQFYFKYKDACDTYFFNEHRNESRGIGGLFFDNLKSIEDSQNLQNFQLTCALGKCFLDAYLPIVNKNVNKSYTDSNKYWQEIRRGRYVEFNLIHDKGTLFGLKTNGRIESIFMSLPPRVRWDYDFKVIPHSAEDKLIQVLKSPLHYFNKP